MSDVCRYRVLLSNHRRALTSVRQFWKLMMKSDVSLPMIQAAFKAIERSEVHAMHAYRVALDRYPRSVKVMRTYARFLLELKFNPTAAARYMEEADKIEDEMATRQREIQFAGGGAATGGASMSVDDAVDGVVVISPVGVIQFVNKLTTRIFGYKGGELPGKNVSCLMPPPFSVNHNT